MKTLASLLVMVALSSWGRHAQACQDTESTSRVVGVDPEGRFVRTTDIPFDREGEHQQHVTLHDADGGVIFQVTQHEGVLDWMATDPPPPEFAALMPVEGGRPRSMEAVVAGWSRRLRLAPLQRSNVPVFTSASEPWLGLKIEAYAKGSGTVLATPMVPWVAGNGRAELLFSPRSALWFLHYRDGSKRSPNVVCAHYTEEDLWFPRSRVRSAMRTANADRLGAAGDVAGAIDLARQAVIDDDGNGRARVALARWSAKSGATWKSARLGALSRSWPGQHCLEPAESLEHEPEILESFMNNGGFDQATYDDWSASLRSLVCID